MKNRTFHHDIDDMGPWCNKEPILSYLSAVRLLKNITCLYFYYFLLLIYRTQWCACMSVYGSQKLSHFDELKCCIIRTLIFNIKNSFSFFYLKFMGVTMVNNGIRLYHKKKWKLFFIWGIWIWVENQAVSKKSGSWVPPNSRKKCKKLV